VVAYGHGRTGRTADYGLAVSKTCKWRAKIFVAPTTGGGLDPPLVTVTANQQLGPRWPNSSN